MNDVSIGICLENIPPSAYTSIQYERLAWLVASIHRRFPNSKNNRILGHSDVAIPRGRKTDPGPHFSYAALDSHMRYYAP
jgi:N-acetylmuramoyl-L-alanine amidase